MLLVSACLAGETVRYDGGHCLKEEIEQRVQEKEARIFCPEVAGGLSTPREPAEIQGGDGYDVLDGTATVQTISGKDVTEAFLNGAQAMLAFAQHQQATCIVLKEDSPSCGSQSIHDGYFTGDKRSGVGVTTALLRRNGYVVMNEKQFIEEYVRK